MKTRLMSSAFLCFGGEVLALHRSENRKIAPGMWSAVGGHIEPAEINDPKSACLREIEEETGLCAESIARLDLRYITIRQADGEMRENYIFIGELREKCALAKTDEGTLHWVKRDALASLPMSFSIKQAVLHWLGNGQSARVRLGAINAVNSGVTWSEL